MRLVSAVRWYQWVGVLCTATVYRVSAPNKLDKMVFVIARKPTPSVFVAL